MDSFSSGSYPPTIIWRHRKENLKKCSLRGLESRDDCLFFKYPQQELPDLTDYILLSIDAQPLSKDDGNRGLLILDGTWRLAEKMLKKVEEGEGDDAEEGKKQKQKQEKKIVFRSLPSWHRTAYPRRQEDCSNPDQGLASVEALFLAYRILGRSTDGILGNYHWKKEFLLLNQDKPTV